MPKNVTVFTRNTCGSCHQLKRWLQAKGVMYSEVNLDQNPERTAEAIQVSGAMTVPVTVVTRQDDAREVVVGLNLAKLAPALN